MHALFSVMVQSKVSRLRTYQSPLRVGSSGKRDARTQFGALCFRRRKSNCEILLLTSRDTGRWIIPKGWPMDGMTPAEVAAAEAWEEAGVKGTAHDYCVGLYGYTKLLEDGDKVPAVVAVFPVEVSRLADDFPEASERKRKWFSQKKAASQVREPDLKQLLRSFDPKLFT